MSDTAAPDSPQDVAWASFKTPLSRDELRAFCQDVERLFRINPYLEFFSWEKLTEDSHHFSGRNSSQEKPFDFDLQLKLEPTADGLIIHYLNGVKNTTRITIEPDAGGSKATITEDYSHTPEDQRQAHLHEVDKSLVTWANDLQAYLLMWKRWSWLRPWRWYMRRIWQPLKPIGRRIVYMFIWISIVEVALIALGVAIYWSEYT